MPTSEQVRAWEHGLPGALQHDLDASKVHAVECARDVQEFRQLAGTIRALHTLRRET